MGARSLAQGSLDLLALLAIQLGFAARSTGSAEGTVAALFPSGVPATHTLARYLQFPGDLGQTELAVSEQARRSLAALLQLSKITSRRGRFLHEQSIANPVCYVNIICEIMSLYYASISKYVVLQSTRA